MRLLRNPGHLSIFPTSKQNGLGPIPSSQFQFPLGIKWSTNYIAIGRKLSNEGSPLHFPYEWDALQLWAAPQPMAAWDSHPSFSAPAHLLPSLPCSLQALFLVVLVPVFSFSNQKSVVQIWRKEIHHGLALIPAGWNSAHGLLWLYLPAHCALHLPGA